MLDIRLLHHLKKLARIGGKRFDIAPLPLGIDGVERQARLTTAGKSGNDDQFVAGKVDIDALEIMLPGAFHFNMGKAHVRALPKMWRRVQRVIRPYYVLYMFFWQVSLFTSLCEWRAGLASALFATRNLRSSPYCFGALSSLSDAETNQNMS